ncbi:MAG: hypothetical protein K2Y56_17255 [Methylobacterium sp.]|uniref:hypothetical protein n=1 Tax=Methylobacterium sp. TaxID=409 RepID=UPI0025D9DE6E|nr:hypothetical protein [Methylobacterium sp.]MBX9933254.1 hypothetical protein [Methylobacterium sp.]
MAGEPYFGDLLVTKVITDADLDAAVDAYFAAPTTMRFAITPDLVVSLAAAVEASPYAQDMLADLEIKELSKRSAVRTAILLARPVPTG